MTIAGHAFAVLAVGAVALSGGAVRAQEDFAKGFENHLTAGHIAAAAAFAEARIAAAPDDAAARFALGLAQFLSAVEGLGQGLHRYGLANTYANDAGLLVFGGGMPFLRLPIPENPAPEPVTYAGLRAVLAGFTDGLGVAEATLAAVPATDFDLPLRVPSVRFDFDGDGQGSEEESVAAVFLAVTNLGFTEAGKDWAKLATGGGTDPLGLDQSDAPWLQAYCHLLTALADFPLAHDWHETFELTFHDVFPATRLPSSGLRDEEQRLVDGLGPEPPDFAHESRHWDEWQAWNDSPEGQARLRWERAAWPLEYGTYFDLGAFVHLMHWPVVEPQRMAAARQHLLRMVELSRENWRRIRAETDDRREWLAGPQQTNLMPGNVQITEETVQGWMLFLDEFEAVLKGERLIQHWRVVDGRGINLRRMFDEPTLFDPILIAQGSTVLPYLEDGETVSEETVETIFDMLEGGLLGYFIVFN